MFFVLYVIHVHRLETDMFHSFLILSDFDIPDGIFYSRARKI